jgi:L-ascorbate metabolism protein UlaG (beta-lactamase superfamily)
MKISYLNHSSFLISGKTPTGQEVTVITDPFDPKFVGTDFSEQTADIVTLSHDHNALHFINGKPNEDYLYFDTPGEFEVKGLIMNGIASFHDDSKGKKRGQNTIFTYDFAEAKIAHLGDIGHLLESDQSEMLSEIDILMVPVGGFYTINPKQAVTIIEEIEPAIVIPMHFKTPKHLNAYDELKTFQDFIAEIGVQPQNVKDFTLKAHKDLPQEMIILEF